MNAKMPALREAFEAAGFADVRTLLSSGNVVFSARTASAAALERKAETAITEHLGLIEETFGKEQTTRTWDTVSKVAR